MTLFVVLMEKHIQMIVMLRKLMSILPVRENVLVLFRQLDNGSRPHAAIQVIVKLYLGKPFYHFLCYHEVILQKAG